MVLNAYSPGPKGGITISSLVMNTQDSSTTTGFDDFDDGTTWSTEIDFQYRLGHLPGGMNVGGIYSFNQDFARLNSRLVVQPDEGLVIPKEHNTWAVFWSTWQYVFIEQPSNQPIDPHDGEPDLQGVGFFIRLGVADRETNPNLWAVSGGVGGRGVPPYRNNDTFGIGYYYNSVQQGRLSGILGIEDSAQGFEYFRHASVSPDIGLASRATGASASGHGNGYRVARWPRLLKARPTKPAHSSSSSFSSLVLDKKATREPRHPDSCFLCGLLFRPKPAYDGSI